MRSRRNSAVAQPGSPLSDKRLDRWIDTSIRESGSTFSPGNSSSGSCKIHVDDFSRRRDQSEIATTTTTKTVKTKVVFLPRRPSVLATITHNKSHTVGTHGRTHLAPFEPLAVGMYVGTYVLTN